MLINFWGYMIADEGSQVVFSSRQHFHKSRQQRSSIQVFVSQQYIKPSIITLILYSLISPALNSLSRSDRLLLSSLTRSFFMVSCFSNHICNTLCIFQFLGSSNLFACFLTAWRAWNGSKNFFFSSLFCFVLMYLLSSQIFLSGVQLRLFTLSSWAVFYSPCA